MIPAGILALVLTAPGVRATWTAPPTVEAFETVAGEQGFVVALDGARWQAALDRIEAAEAEAQACARVVAALQDQAEAQAAVTATEVADRDARLEILERDVRKADRAAIRAGRRWWWLAAGVVAGVAVAR